MIRTQKSLLSDFSFKALLAVLFLSLVVFFLFAIVQGRYFFPLAVMAFLSLCILIPTRSAIYRYRTVQQLRQQELDESLNLQEAEILRDRLALSAIHQNIFNYSQLKGLTETLGTSFSLYDASRVLAQGVENLFSDKKATVILYLFLSKTDELSLSFSQKGGVEGNIRTKKGDIFDHWVAKTLKPLLVEDSRSDFRFDLEKDVAEDQRVVRSLMSVPLTVGTRAVGVLRLDSDREHAFSTDDVRLLSVVGDLAAVTIENVQLYERVEDLAIRDSLTGLYLRRYFMERLPQEISRALRQKKELALLMIDLDKFKDYNDTYGHAAGDILLKTVAMILLYLFDQPGNMVCRYGGEEFAVLLPDCGRTQALKMAEEFRKKIESQAIILRRQKTHITTSVGLAVVPGNARVKDDFVQQADAALYRAKRRGRNRVCEAKES